jgi:hypothetical protein
MAGPRRTSGETVPFEREELAKLTRQTENKVPTVKPSPAPGAAAPNANVVAGRRGNSAHSLIKAPPPPPPADGEGEDEEVVIEMTGDDDEDAASASAPPRRSRSDTLSDPMMTSMLAQAARDAPAPPPATPTVSGPNRNVKRRGG